MHSQNKTTPGDKAQVKSKYFIDPSRGNSMFIAQSNVVSYCDAARTISLCIDNESLQIHSLLKSMRSCLSDGGHNTQSTLKALIQQNSCTHFVIKLFFSLNDPPSLSKET